MNYYDEELQELLQQTMREKRLRAKAVDLIMQQQELEERTEELKKIMENPQYDAPKLVVNPDVKNFYDFKVEDFALEGYVCSKMEGKLEVAV